MILRNTWLKRTGLTATLGIKAMFNIAGFVVIMPLTNIYATKSVRENNQDYHGNELLTSENMMCLSYEISENINP